MKPSITTILMAIVLVVIGLGFAAAGLYVGQTDDAPGAAFIGFVLMIGSLVLAVRIMRRKMQSLFGVEVENETIVKQCQ